MYLDISDLFGGGGGGGDAKAAPQPGVDGEEAAAAAPPDAVEQLLSEPSPYRQPPGTSSISGLSTEESDRLVERLFAAAEQAAEWVERVRDAGDNDPPSAARS